MLYPYRVADDPCFPSESEHMTEAQGWLERFDREHRDLSPATWIAALVVVFGTVGVLWSLPVPPEFYEISPFLNWGSAFLMATAVYYFIISLSLAIGMLPFVLGLGAFQLWLENSGHPAMQTSLALFALGLAGLWFGHRRRGGILAVIKDLQHMMIAPAWMLWVIYRWVGIPT